MLKQKIVTVIFLIASLCSAGAILSPTPATIGEEGIDHLTVEVWNIILPDAAMDDIVNGTAITGARLYIDGIYNSWDEPNELFIHMLDDHETFGQDWAVVNSTPEPDRNDANGEKLIQT